MDYCKSHNFSTKKKKIVLKTFLLFFCGVFLLTPLFALALTVDISATVAGCGDGVVANGEQCDGGNLNGATCASRGFAGGALSCTAVCTFNTTACTVAQPGGGGGGGGGGFPAAETTRVVFTGRAYPLSQVILLKDGVREVSTIAGPDSEFQISISALTTGNYTFSLYAEDAKKVRSDLFSFSVYITAGATTKVGGIFLAPTISLNKTTFQKGETAQVFGQSVPGSNITISVHSKEELFFQTKADEKGTYLYRVDTSFLEVGDHQVKSKSLQGDDISTFSRSLRFIVKEGNTPDLPVTQTKGDVSGDSVVNIIDFSILAYWYNRPAPPASADLNKDGKINLIDFSIMAFYWTG